MGLMYERGKFVAADPAKAIAWYEKAARGGQPQAPINLGLMYQGDRGVPADLRRAAYWFAEGARLGNAWGFSDLGWLYQSGRGVDPDPGLAAELYAQALRIDPDDAGATATKNFVKLPPKAPVRGIQKRLSALGYDVGAADGSWNKQTRDAVGAFAKAQGLDLDANAPKIRILAALIEAADRPTPKLPAAN
jgi:TPR repeat protein